MYRHRASWCLAEPGVVVPGDVAGVLVHEIGRARPARIHRGIAALGIITGCINRRLHRHIEIGAGVGHAAIGATFGQRLEELAVDTGRGTSWYVYRETKLDDLPGGNHVLIGGQGAAIGVVDSAEIEVRTVVIAPQLEPKALARLMGWLVARWIGSVPAGASDKPLSSYQATLPAFLYSKYALFDWPESSDG